MTEPHWIASPAWRLEVHGGLMVASAGADEVLLLDEAPPEHHERLLQAWAGDGCAALQADAELGGAVRQLRRLGALLPAQALAAPAAMRAQLQWWGTPCEPLVGALRANAWQIEAPGSAAPLVLHVRTDHSWQALLTAYAAQAPATPHLLIDLAYHHTVCLGPLVVPGQTACLACLGHRVARRWGDLPPPPAPQLLHRAAQVAALLADGALLGTRLLERCISLDLRALRLDTHRVFQLPDCPVCARHADPQLAGAAGALPLPWLS